MSAPEPTSLPVFLRQRTPEERIAYLTEKVAELYGDRAWLKEERNRLARECADLRDAAATTRQAERERIGDWFATQGDEHQTNGDPEIAERYYLTAAVIRDDIPEYRTGGRS